jgi:hypothetical protein
MHQCDFPRVKQITAAVGLVLDSDQNRKEKSRAFGAAFPRSEALNKSQRSMGAMNTGSHIFLPDWCVLWIESGSKLASNSLL